LIFPVLRYGFPPYIYNLNKLFTGNFEMTMQTNMNAMKWIPALLLAAVLSACDSGPKVIEVEDAQPQGGSAVNNALQGQTGTAAADGGGQEQHKVVAEETLHTDKYTYVRASENGQSIWIAIPKSNVQIGTTYYYTGGLMKKNFQSKEYDRVFETLYLVSGLTTEPGGAQGGSGSAVDQALSGGPHNHEADITPPTSEIAGAKGSVKISSLMANLGKYDGKVIKVTGKCVKLNPMIMGRNWLHIQDGSANNFDLTVTTTEQVQLGSIVTMEGTIALNRDFGAGYKYNVIMEGATVLK
jgi:hypothetical protein